MRGRWLVLLLLPSYALTAPDAPGPGNAHAIIGQCATHAAAESRGLDALRAACPQIDSAAENLGLNSVLPRGWQSRVDAESLANLDALAEHYVAPAPTAMPDPARLRAIARTMEAKAPPLSPWDRLMLWIAQWLQSASWPDWLRPHWSLLPRFWNALTYVLAAAVVLAAVAIVLFEVRAARRPGRHSQRGMARMHAGDLPAAGPAWPDITAIETASPRERPVLALRLLVGALTRSQRLDRDRNLTCRELVTAAKFDSGTQQEQFKGLAVLAEQALYACATAPLTAEPDVNRVRQLYEALLLTPGEPGATRP